MRSPDRMEMEKEQEAKDGSQPKQRQEDPQGGGGGGGGWGGWSTIRSLSVLSDLQRAAEEISKNAVAAAKNAAKSIAAADVQDASDSESTAAGKDAASPATGQATDISREGVAASSEEGGEETQDRDDGDENHLLLRNSALDRLEKASEDGLLGQGLKVFDNSVENFASGAWLALGSALKGGSTLVQRLENSATSLADSIQHASLPMDANSLAPSILESGKSFTAKGIEVLERVGKETMELLITETGLGSENDCVKFDRKTDEEQLEEVTFDRCFYIYGGPEQLEELEALSNHYALLYNRRKTKFSSEQKSMYDGKLNQIQQILKLATEIGENGTDPDKGKSIEMADDGSSTEMKFLHDSSISKAADIAAEFAAAVGGLARNEIILRTTDRLETVHTEAVHRLSELSSSAVSYLLMLGKSVISNANKLRNDDMVDLKVEWPDDSVSKAKIIRSKAQIVSGYVESVAKSFLTGISDIMEASQASMGSSVSSSDGMHQENPLQERANSISTNLLAVQATALAKVHDALQYLGYVLSSTSMPT